MKIDKRFTILGLCIVVFFVSIIIGISFAFPENLTSSEYIIKNNTIYAVPTTYKFRAGELLEKINSDTDLKVYNTNNQELKVGDSVISGYTLKADNTSYNIIVLGDVTSDGTINLGDVSKLYNAYKGKSTLNSNERKSGDTTQDNNINLGDVSKLYNYFRGNKAFSYFEKNIIDIDNMVDQANTYYESHTTSNLLGSNLIDKFDINHTNTDRAILTKNGKVEVAMKRDNKCYRKNAISNYVEKIDKEYCDVNNLTAFPSNSGRLHVSGSKLMNERNEEVVLNGVSVEYDLLKLENIFNDNHLGIARKWGTNVFRIFVDNGLYQGNFIDNKDEYTEKIIETIDKVIENDMYVILNWNPGPHTSKEEHAIDLFTRISSHYKNNPYIIYEIWNEAYGSEVDWQVMKDYANTIIPIIRSNAPDSIILVCTPNGTTIFDTINSDPLNYNNLMYVLHNYTEGMTDTSYEKARSAIRLGIPIFVTEWAATSSSSKTDPYYWDEAYGTSFAKFLINHNLSFTYYTFQPMQWCFGLTAPDGWTKDLEDETLKPSGKFYKKVLQRKFDTEYSVMTNLNKNLDKFRSDEYKEKIVSVTFKNTINIPSNVVVQWDMSMIQDNSVIGYLTPASEEGMYDLVICANGKIEAPVSMTDFFAGMKNVKTIDLRNLYTDNVIHMNGMFYNCSSLTTLDLEHFDVSHVNNISSMFCGCINLENLNINGWTSNEKLVAVGYAFYACRKLKSIDISGLDVSKVTSFDGTFGECLELEYINISNWEPEKIDSFKAVFRNNKVLKEVDMSSMEFNNSDASITNLFYQTNSNAIIYLKNPKVKEQILGLDSNLSAVDFRYRVESDNGTSGNTLWNYDCATSTLTISGSGDMADYTLDHLPPWYKYKKNIENIVIGENITALGKFAFYDLTYVKNFRINSILLKDLSCDDKDINFGTNYTLYSTGSKYGMTLVFGENVTYIPSMLMAPYGYSNTIKVTNVIFEGDKITGVGLYSLARLSTNSLVLKEGHTAGRGHAFGSSSMLNLIILPDSLHEISNYLMRNDSALEKVVFGSSINSIKSGVFENDKNLNTLVIPHIENTTNVYASNFSTASGKTITVYGDSSTEEWVTKQRTVNSNVTFIYKNINEYNNTIKSNTNINTSVGYNGEYSFTSTGSVKAYYTYTNSNNETILTNELDITKNGNTYTINNIKQDVYIEIN